MTKYFLTKLSEAKEHFEEAKPEDCICWQCDDDNSFPFGIGCNPQSAEDNGIDRISDDEDEQCFENGFSYSFSIVVPDDVENSPAELIDFSFIFEEEGEDPYDYMDEYGLIIAFSEQPYQWIGSFGDLLEVNKKLSIRENQGSYFIITPDRDYLEDFVMQVTSPPSFHFIEAIRRSMNLKTSEAAKLLDITEKEWRSFRSEKTPMNKWQWSIFQYFSEKNLRKLYHFEK